MLASQAKKKNSAYVYVLALFQLYRSGQSISFASEDLPQVWYWIISFEVGVKKIHAFGNISQ